MFNSWIIAKRELSERWRSRSFRIMAVLGPLVLLGMLYLLFAYGGEGKQQWNVLIADPTGIMESKILANEDKSLHYSFADGYIEMEEFRDAKQYQQFDALVEINEKVLSNKTAFVFYRTKPAIKTQTRVQYQIERRMEEIMVARFTDLSLKDFRKIKQPLNVAFRNVYDPNDSASDLRGWVGYLYGLLIVTFVFLFGMTVLRSVTSEKSNRIVEVLMATVDARQLMFGKILGIGLAALIQFVIWFLVIGTGLFFMRTMLFPDLLEASNLDFVQMTEEMKSLSAIDQLYAAREYNEFVSLIFERVNFVTMTSYFALFFVVGYLFYAAFFAAIGATAGSESDGQQFVLPIVFILCLSVYAGYHSLQHPESSLSNFFHYLPFTSPVVVMVKLSLGYAPGTVYTMFIALAILLLSTFFMLTLAARLYKNGILQYGHRLKWNLIFTWLKKN